jgi:hypothetical protein
MSLTYQLNQQIHTLAQEKAKKHGLELVIKNNRVFVVDVCLGTMIRNMDEHNYTNLPVIQADQIRQILLTFKDILGENPQLKKALERHKDTTNRDTLLETYNKQFFVTFADGEIIENGFLSQAQALCQKWLDGLTPLFDREPEKVLTELLEILQKI